MMRLLVAIGVALVAACGTGDGESAADCGPAGDGPTGRLDVVGITIGMPAQAALAKIACANSDLRPNWTTSLTDLSIRGPQPRDSMWASDDEQSIRVTLAGPPGDERVVAVERRLSFAGDKRPVVDRLVRQLDEKYGAMSPMPPIGTGHRRGIARDAGDRPLPVDFVSRCSTVIVEHLQNCGPIVVATIDTDGNNDRLVRTLTVAVEHHRYAAQRRAEWQSISRAARQRREQMEVNEAQERTPQL